MASNSDRFSISESITTFFFARIFKIYEYNAKLIPTATNKTIGIIISALLTGSVGPDGREVEVGDGTAVDGCGCIVGDDDVDIEVNNPITVTALRSPAKPSAVKYIICIRIHIPNV